MENEILAQLGSKGIKTDTYWSYLVERRGEDLILSFKSRPFIRKIRLHASDGYYPYKDHNMSKGDKLVVLPSQWTHGLVDGNWSRMTDLDNR